MNVWTSARIKSNKHGDVIAHYNLELHNKLKNAVVRFFIPCGITEKEEVVLLPTTLFICMSVESLDELTGIYSDWLKLEPNIFYPSTVKDNEDDTIHIETISDDEMAEFMSGVSEYFETSGLFGMKIGDEVEVISGYFRGQRGVISDVRKENVVLLLPVMKTAVPVTVLKSTIQAVV